MPDTYWSQASVLVKYVGQEEGGMENLKGKKIALVYHDSAYGKEPVPTLRNLSESYGYQLNCFRLPIQDWSRRRPGSRSAASCAGLGNLVEHWG